MAQLNDGSRKLPDALTRVQRGAWYARAIGRVRFALRSIVARPVAVARARLEQRRLVFIANVPYRYTMGDGHTVGYIWYNFYESGSGRRLVVPHTSYPLLDQYTTRSPVYAQLAVPWMRGAYSTDYVRRYATAMQQRYRSPRSEET